MADENSVNDIAEMFNGVEPMYNVEEKHNQIHGRYFVVSGNEKYEKIFNAILESCTPYEKTAMQIDPYKGKFYARIKREN